MWIDYSIGLQTIFGWLASLHMSVALGIALGRPLPQRYPFDLWDRGFVIDTARFSEKLPRIAEPSGRLTLTQRKCLLRLVLHLYDLHNRYPYPNRYGWLARWIDEYLAADACAGEGYGGFTDMYLHRMAAELARRKLRLGTIWDEAVGAVPCHLRVVGTGRWRAVSAAVGFRLHVGEAGRSWLADTRC